MQVAVLLLTLSLAASLAAGPQIGIDTETARQIGDLVKQLLKKGDGAAVSKGIRLTDAESGRRASLRIVHSADTQLLLTLEFPAADERLFPHTFRLTADGQVLTPRVLELRESRDEDDPELVLAPLSFEQLDTLADAATLEIFLRGWDEKFSATLDDKGMSKLRRFREDLSATEP